MRAFEGFRSLFWGLFQLMYVLIICTVIIVGIWVFADPMTEEQRLAVLSYTAVIVICAMFSSLTLMITICCIDTRNFLAELTERRRNSVGGETR